MPVRAILFDIDGTLVDSNDLHVRTWAEVFAAKGHHLDPAAIREQIGKGGDMLVPALLPGVSDEEEERLSEAHGEVFKRKYLDTVKPFPGAHDVIARVHGAGFRVALASSAKQEELDRYMDLLDLRALVDATTTIDDVENSKPAPDLIAAALGKLGLSGEEVLFVGDTPYDVESAGKCGVATVAVLSGGFSREALDGARVIYEDAAALAAAFPEWVGR